MLRILSKFLLGHHGQEVARSLNETFDSKAEEMHRLPKKQNEAVQLNLLPVVSNE
jgi:hypothetical protein